MPNNPLAWYKILDWVPSIPGKFSVCSKAIDTSLLQSPSSCFTLLVGVTNPQVNLSTIYPNNYNFSLTSNLDNSSFTFTCEFTVEVIKPINSAYINVFSAENDTLVYSLDSKFLNTTYIINMTLMEFEIPIGSLLPGNYYILFDYGVALFAQFCNPLTYPINNKTEWTFSIQRSSTSKSIANTTKIITDITTDISTLSKNSTLPNDITANWSRITTEIQSSNTNTRQICFISNHS